ncbi:hypothetical protein [Mucilaginibacter sp. Mucisp84]|uniref:hypothetical protein n=1 Tax=Mucilaginibacter sp. Mucisp84 TaxID=3243058 RepID=UPI0039A63A8E
MVNNRYGQGNRLPIKLKGLDPAKRYSLKEINLYPGSSTLINGKKTYSGIS